MEEKLSLVFPDEKDFEIFKNYFENLDKISEDIFYEIGYMFKKGVKIDDILFFLKNNQLGFNHKNFDIAKQKIKNIDMLNDDNFDCEDGVEKCSKCGSLKTISYNKQTRSSDEGFTVFIYCISCKNRQVLNS
jgi:hypothetical protein